MPNWPHLTNNNMRWVFRCLRHNIFLVLVTKKNEPTNLTLTRPKNSRRCFPTAAVHCPISPRSPNYLCVLPMRSISIVRHPTVSFQFKYFLNQIILLLFHFHSYSGFFHQDVGKRGAIVATDANRTPSKPRLCGWHKVPVFCFLLDDWWLYWSIMWSFAHMLRHTEQSRHSTTILGTSNQWSTLVAFILLFITNIN